MTELQDFTRAVYSAPRRNTAAQRFARAVNGPDDGPTYHSPPQVQRHWFSGIKRQVGTGDQGDFDALILLTAKLGKGRGKSALAQYAATDMDKGFAAEMETRVVFKAPKVIELVNTLSRGEAWIYDEGGEGLLRTEFWSEESRAITKAIMMSRDSHTIGFVCIPTLRIFNSAFMDSFVDYWWRIEDRGTALVHPRPPERYTKLRGTGWFPDRDWNPLVWPHPRDWDGPRAGLWDRYRALRLAARQEALTAYGEGLEKGTYGKRTKPSAEIVSCPVCGLTSYRNNILVHKCKGPPKAPERGTAPIPAT